MGWIYTEYSLGKINKKAFQVSLKDFWRNGLPVPITIGRTRTRDLTDEKSGHSRQMDFKISLKQKSLSVFPERLLAEWTGLEPATSCVTGRHSNQLNYHSVCFVGTRSF